MQALRQLGGGIAIALVSIILVIGGISLALAESASSLETPTQALPTLPLSFSTSTVASVSTQTETPTATATVTALPSASVIPVIPPTACTPPSGWFQTTVGANDTIYTIAQRYNTSEDALKNANCLISLDLQAGRILHVPPVPTVYVIPCSPPAGWVRTHIVQAGDNLFRIALSYGITYPRLQSGNCMGSSVTIYTGQRLWVPNRPTLTPVPGVTIVPTYPTNTPSFTSAPSTATSTFIVTSSPAPTASQTIVNTATPTVSLTPVP